MEFDAKLIEARKLEEISENARTGKGKSNVFTKAEWEAARAKHRAKMNDGTSRA